MSLINYGVNYVNFTGQRPKSNIPLQRELDQQDRTPWSKDKTIMFTEEDNARIEAENLIYQDQFIGSSQTNLTRHEEGLKALERLCDLDDQIKIDPDNKELNQQRKDLFYTPQELQGVRDAWNTIHNFDIEV